MFTRSNLQVSRLTVLKRMADWISSKISWAVERSVAARNIGPRSITAMQSTREKARIGCLSVGHNVQAMNRGWVNSW